MGLQAGFQNNLQCAYGDFEMAWLYNQKSGKMVGLNGEEIHGDSLNDSGTASRGCIILNMEQRKAIVRSGNSSLVVR